MTTSKTENYATFMDRLRAHGDWRVLCVKVADRIDNVRSLNATPTRFAVKQIAETTDVYMPLADLMVARAEDTLNPSAIRTAKELRSILHKSLMMASMYERARQNIDVL